MADTLASTTAAPSAPPATGNPPAPAPAPQAAPAPVTPGSKAWAEMTPEQRHAQLRGPENPRARGYSPAIEQREAAAARAAGEAPPPPTADQQPPPAAGEKIKIGKYEISETELGEMMTRQASDDLRKATLPPTPQDYKLEISPGAKLPGGMTVKFDGNDPVLRDLAAWAHSKGLDQTAVSEMLTFHATRVAQQETQLAARAREELNKAGINAGARVDAVGKWITGEVGEADARPIRATIVTDAHLRFYERLMQKIETQGVGSFSQSHRAAPDADKIPGYENMSFEQRRFAQDQTLAQRKR